MSYKGQSNTLCAPGPRQPHPGRVHAAVRRATRSSRAEIKSILQPGQWNKLINRISQIPEPIVPIAPSKYAIRTAGKNAAAQREPR